MLNDGARKVKRRGPGEDGDDLDGFMDEVRPEALEILDRYGIAGSRAITVLSHAWVVTARSEGNRASKRRQFLAAVEYACRDLRAELGPLEEEVEDERVH